MARKKNLPAGMSPQAFSKGGKVLKQKSAKVPRKTKQTAGTPPMDAEDMADGGADEASEGGMACGGKVKYKKGGKVRK